MVKTIVMEEFHLTFVASAGLPDRAYRAVRTTLDDRRFQADLRRAIRSVAIAYPALCMITVRLSR